MSRGERYWYVNRGPSFGPTTLPNRVSTGGESLVRTGRPTVYGFSLPE